MFNFNLQFGSRSLRTGLLRSLIGLPLGIGMLVGLSPTVSAIQMPMADDTEMEGDGADLLRVKWLDFNPTGSRAKFQMPFKPRFVERTFTPVIGRPPIKVRLYSGTASAGKTNLMFSYNDMNERPRGIKGVANTLEGVVRGSLANVSGQLLNKTEIVMKGVKGRQFAYQFTDQQGNEFTVLSRAFLKGRRIYQLSAVMGKQIFNETLAAEFLNSFKIVRPKSDLPPTPKPPPKYEGLLKDQ